MSEVFRHRIQIPASVVFDIVTDSPQPTEDEVKAAVYACFNLDAGDGLDRTVLDGRHARLYIQTDESGLAIKEFAVYDTMPSEIDEVDVYPCVRCNHIIASEEQESHEEFECNPICCDCQQPIGDAESMNRNNGQLSHLDEEICRQTAVPDRMTI
jgi:hypothetical protein